MLASLELFGFKSFADRTTFRFAPGVTAVVGPNGSGKSNVVDAIKWVLGDQSAKSLRGKEMTDVIFNGATGRKPGELRRSDVDVRQRVAASCRQPTNEVRVGRRLWRNGDSEYLLNDQVVRLKDVRDLFLGTGAGASAYAIIEQGRVDQILQANAVGRRAVFEEAAGISRYKAKRVDALRRLERVEQNLLRLTDIVDEVEAQLTCDSHTGCQGGQTSRGFQGTRSLVARAGCRRLSSHDRPARDAQSAARRKAKATRRTGPRAGRPRRRAWRPRLAARRRRRRSPGGENGSRQPARNDRRTRGDGEISSRPLGRTGRRAGPASTPADVALIRAMEAGSELKHNARVLASSQAEYAQREVDLQSIHPELDELSRRIEADRAADRERPTTAARPTSPGFRRRKADRRPHGRTRQRRCID